MSYFSLCISTVSLIFSSYFLSHFFVRFLQLSEKRWKMSTSPQSTLSHMSSWAGRSAGGSTNGSPNGFPSPPTTPNNDAVDHLIYLAAGHVAKLSLRGGEAAGPAKNKGFLAPQRSLEQLYPAAVTSDPSVIPNIYVRI